MSSPTLGRKLTLVLGSTGKTGRRVLERLTALGVAVRGGSRSATPPFDWQDRDTWAPAIENVRAAYVTFYPDLAVPAAPAAIEAFVELAARQGVRRLVLLSGRGEDEAQRCEQIVQASGLEWTIIRSSWFAQNWSEGFMRELLFSGEVALPAGDVREPFVDVEDIAEIAVAALTEDGHAGRLYEVTGPRLLSFAEAVAEIAAASGHTISYVPIGHAEFAAALAEQQVPRDIAELLVYLFTTVLDGRNEYVAGGVQQALGRPARDFSAYVRDAAAGGVWSGGLAAV